MFPDREGGQLFQIALGMALTQEYHEVGDATGMFRIEAKWRSAQRAADAFHGRGSGILDDAARLGVIREATGGLTVEETAEALGVSPRTVKREWSMAKAWLHKQIRNQ